MPIIPEVKAGRKISSSKSGTQYTATDIKDRWPM